MSTDLPSTVFPKDCLSTCDCAAAVTADAGAKQRIRNKQTETKKRISPPGANRVQKSWIFLSSQDGVGRTVKELNASEFGLDLSHSSPGFNQVTGAPQSEGF